MQSSCRSPAGSPRLAANLGRRRYFLLSIAIFTISSVFCGMAKSLNQLILFRVVQGLAGGGLQPSSQGILLDTFPPEKQGAAQTLFGVAALIAPVLGPTLGGWITDQYSWRWIFYINLPVGALAFFLCWATVQDPEYLREARKALRRGPLNFDSIGLGLLVVTLVCWEVLLSKGQEWDWLGDAFGRVQTLVILLILGGCGFGFLGNATHKSDREFPTAPRSQLCHLLSRHFLRLRSALRIEHIAARHAGIAVWLRRFPCRAGIVACRHLYDHSDCHRRLFAGPGR